MYHLGNVLSTTTGGRAKLTTVHSVTFFAISVPLEYYPEMLVTLDSILTYKIHPAAKFTQTRKPIFGTF